MSTYLIVHLKDNNPEQSVSWMRYDTDSGATPVAHGALAEVAHQSAGARVVILVSALDILITDVVLPTQNRKKMLLALPYALEDELISDIDALHFALGDKIADNKVVAAIVAHDAMRALQTRLVAAGVIADYIIPDVLALPLTEGSWSALLTPGVALIKQSALMGFATDAANARTFVELALKEESDSAPQKIQLWRNAEDAEYIDFSLDADLELAVDECDKEGLLALIAKHGFDPKKAINLLQGDYSRRERIGKVFRPWRAAAALAGIWFILKIGMVTSEGMVLDSQNERLRDQVTEIYKSAFPDTKKVVNARVQMERKLAELRGEGPVSNAGFMKLIAESGQVLRDTQGLILQSVRFKTGELDVELEVPSLQMLDELKQKLSSQGGLLVEIQSAASKDNKVQGRLQIKSQSS